METDCYPPGRQTSTEEPKVKALQAEVKDIKSEMAKLTQDRSATSTRNNKNNSNSKNNSRNDSSNSAQSSPGPSILKNKDASKTVRFSDTSNSASPAPSPVNEAIKKKVEALGGVKNIKSDAVHTVELNGKVVAKWCHKCRRFTKGEKIHATSEHVKKPKSEGSGLMAQARGTPNASPADDCPTFVEFSPPVDYSFGDNSLRRSAGFLSATARPSETEGDDASYSSCNGKLLQTLDHPSKG